MRCPQVPQMMMPCRRAGPSRGGPAARSRPCAAALAASLAMLASHWSRVMYPGWAPGMKEIHSSRGTVMLARLLHSGVLAVADPGLLDRQHGHVRLQDGA